MLRITETSSGESGASLYLEGRLAGPWVAVLQGCCANHLQNQKTLSLDLSKVSFADQAGVALLTSLQCQQVTLRACSPFIREQIQSARTSPTDDAS